MQAIPISAEEQTALLRWAREAVERAARGCRAMEIPDSEITEAMRKPFAAFVTLKKDGELRGCIGKMNFARPLWNNVISAAQATALEDPRFEPVRPEELPALRLEISALERPVELLRIEDYDAQHHGIIIEKGFRHALLLPKVAQEYGWDATKTLQVLCAKAGLPAGAWQESDARLQVFEAFDFGESFQS